MSFGAKELEGMFSRTGGAGEGDEEAAVFVPKLDKAKKQGRLRAGVTPKWAREGGEDEDGRDSSVAMGTEPVVFNVSAAPGAGGNSTAPVRAPAIVPDRRLALAQCKPTAATTTSTDIPTEEDTGPRRRRIYQAEVIVETQPVPAVEAHETTLASAFTQAVAQKEKEYSDEEEEEKGEVEVAAPVRRRVVAQEVEVLARAASEEDEEQTGSSEYETDTDSEEEEEAVPELPKPVFIPRAQRQMQQAQHEREMEEARHKQVTREKEQQKVSRAMAAESIRRGDTMTNADDGNDSDAGCPDDTDDTNLERALEEWQLRELERLQRDVDERSTEITVEQDLLARRNMTDEQVIALRREERAAEAEAAVKAGGNGSSSSGTTEEKSTKNYHKGAFFVDDDAIAAGGANNPLRRDLTGMTQSEATFSKGVKTHGGLKDAKLRTGSGKYQAQ